MIDRVSDYWLYIESYVHCAFSNSSVLLYNTLDGNYIESNDKKIIDLIKSVYKKENLGVIRFNGKKLKNNVYKELIIELKIKYIGDLIPIELSKHKPIQLMPVVNLQKDIDKLNEFNKQSIGEGVLEYLNSISIYINNECAHACSDCAFLFKQANCCKSAEVNIEFPVSKIKDILDQIKYAPLSFINIIGGNILKYSQINELTRILEERKEIVRFWNHYLNCSIEEFLIIESFPTEIIITFPIIENKLQELIHYSNPHKTRYNFYITNLDDYDTTELLIKKYSINSYRIKPIFNSFNYSFFNENVYLNKEDIFASIIEQKRIFANQKLNTNFFGSLIVFQDGEIKANSNTSSIGNIDRISILESIYLELTNNTAWRIIRNKKPCNKCVYQWLCPSPSGYEQIIGRPNLCNIVSD